MKKTILLLLTTILSIAFFAASCSKDDDGNAADSLIGTWKLIEVYEGSNSVSLSSCNLMETFIIGQDGQYSHELFGNSGKSGSSFFSNKSDDDSDDDGDDDGDDDDHSSDDDDDDDNTNPGGGTSDDDSDDDNGNGGGSGVCASTELSIGYWLNTANDGYTFTANNIVDTKNIVFIENNTKFYYEITTVVNGVSVTKKYVFARQ